MKGVKLANVAVVFDPTSFTEDEHVSLYVMFAVTIPSIRAGFQFA